LVIECTCQKDGRFPLRDLLLQSIPIGQVANHHGQYLHGNDMPALRHAEIVYFAASVFGAMALTGLGFRMFLG